MRKVKNWLEAKEGGGGGEGVLWSMICRELIKEYYAKCKWEMEGVGPPNEVIYI